MSDLISREALCRHLRRIIDSSSNSEGYNEGFNDGLEFAISHADTMSSADRPTGEWISYKGMQPPELHGKHYCSNCYHAIHLASNGNVYNYCPNCGARMKGADDE